jgi:hypothetical protein
MRRLFPEVIQPETQRVEHIRNANLSYAGMRDGRICPRQNMEGCHGSHSSTNQSSHGPATAVKDGPLSNRGCECDYTENAASVASALTSAFFDFKSRRS